MLKGRYVYSESAYKDSEGVIFTVGELKELFSRYEDTDLVNFCGGEDSDGEFCGFTVADCEEDLW